MSFVDPETFENLGGVHLAPDLNQRLAEIKGNPVTAIAHDVALGQRAPTTCR